MNRSGQVVCLTMIVKDEAPVIRRCLDSVRPLIDRWAIVDTGSTDGTQEIVREHLRDLPGTLVERPWVDFAHNRSEAIEYAREGADYLFVIDADEVLELDEGFELPRLEADSYNAEVAYAGCTYLRKQFVRAALPWRYRGVVHEYLECPEARTEGFLPGLRTVPHRDGARARDPNTYRRDALVIERALIDEPDNTRYVFYLAQSYRDSGEHELAIRHYRRRAEMGGWPEEVWYSLYQVAVLEERLERPWPEVMADYLAAHEMRPDRAGPLFRIGAHYRRLGQNQLAHLFLARAMEIPYPAADRLFVERALYDYGIAIEYAVASYYVGDHAAAIETNNRLLRSDRLPPELVEHVVRNRRFSLDALAPSGRRRPAPRLTVALVLGSPGPELDDCVDSLLRQDLEAFDVVILDEAAGGEMGPRLPLDDPRFELRPAPTGVDHALRELVAQRGVEDAILLLTPSHRLAGAGALRTFREAFEDAGCALAYGRHRTPSGRIGDAEPAASEAVFGERGPALAGGSPIAVRAGLAQRVAQEGDLRSALWRGAGLAVTRFLDDVLTVATGDPPAAAAPVRTVRPGAGPLVSCLLVTGERVAMAKRAIRSFAEQTHPNRELVVVTDGPERVRRSLELYVETLGLDAVRFVYPEGSELALGHLRNVSIDAARGEVLCQWDDDDYSHPQRLERQLGFMLERDAGACFLTDHLQLLEDHRLLFWIDWTGGGRVDGMQKLVPGTAMVARDAGVRYPEDGPYARRGEDSAFLATLLESVPVAHMEDAGHLWLYTFHGANTYPREHHIRMSAFGAPRQFVGEREQRIRAALAHYPIPRPAVVAGRDGPAFAVA
uniref:Glycosyl transferase, group 2 family protein n=1 Tax=uncultured bacterium AB_162 TaxID=1630011 RepID=A0A0E3M0B0_9BACT|nr:glycosyl transferase, group 2 family protein [uncultured bacterium AB_162]